MEAYARGHSSEQLSSLASREGGLMESFQVTTVGGWTEERDSPTETSALLFQFSFLSGRGSVS